MSVNSDHSSNNPAPKVRRIAIGLSAVLAILAVIGYSQRESLHQWSVNRKSIAELALIEPQAESDVYTHYLYARKLVNAGQVSEAKAPAERAVRALTESTPPELAAHALALSGFLGAESGDQKRAEEVFKQIEGTVPGDPFIHLGRASIASKGNHRSDAVDELEKAVKADPSCAESWRRLGRAYLESAEPEVAAVALRHAATMLPNVTAIHMSLGNALLQTKQFKEAADVYRLVARLSPNEPYAATLPIRVQAFAARSDSEYEQAVASLRQALESRPGDDGLRAELAGLHMRFTKFRDARQELETILNHNPMISAECWLNLQTVYKRLGDPASAATAMTHVRGIIALKTEAAGLKEECMARPQDAHLALRLSNVLGRLGKTDESFAVLSRAVSLDPHDPDIQRALSAAQAMQRARQ